MYALSGLGAGLPLLLILAGLSARRIWMMLLSAVALFSRDQDQRRTALEVLRLMGKKPDKTKSYLPPASDD